MDDIAPNEARIRGTITAIYEERSGSGPCAQAPCAATVRVDSVLGYGSAFPRPISRGEHLDVRFAFTLAPTAELDMNLDDSYPGLELGSSFRADVQGQMSPGGPSFVVYSYYPADD